MNMKQSCKALICAIEGELDGRHCTEEQAAAILDHALPSLTEALARVETERDEAAQIAIDISVQRDTTQAQLSEADALLTNVMNCTSFREIGEVEMAIAAYFARHTQAEQQEVQVIGDRISAMLQAVAPSQEAQGAQVGDEPIPHFRFEDRDGNAEWYVRLSDHRAALATQPAVPEPVAYCDDFTLGMLKGGQAFSVGVTPAAQRHEGENHALYAVAAAVRGAEHE